MTMTYLKTRIALCATLVIAPICLSLAEGEGDKDKGEKKEKAESTGEKKSETKGAVTVGGKKIDYDATAGTIQLKNQKDEPRASVFYIAYTRSGVEDLTKRPITFCFNGGPGSSSVWLHLGAFGPKRVHLSADGIEAPKPPFRLVENEYSLLGDTDLVFIDPVSTWLQSCGGWGGCQAVPRVQRGHRFGSGVHPALRYPPRALGITEVFGW